MTDEEFARAVAKARKVNARRDRQDQKAGFAAPLDSPPDAFLMTVAFAIQAGMQAGDVDCLAEAYVMCKDMAHRFRERQR